MYEGSRGIGTPRVDLPNLRQHLTTRREGGAPLAPSAVRAVEGLLELYGIIGRMTHTRVIEALRIGIGTDERVQLEQITHPLLEAKKALESGLISIGQQNAVRAIDKELEDVWG